MLIAGSPPMSITTPPPFPPLYNMEQWVLLTHVIEEDTEAQTAWLSEVAKFTEAVSRKYRSQTQIWCILKPAFFLDLLTETHLGWTFTTSQGLLSARKKTENKPHESSAHTEPPSLWDGTDEKQDKSNKVCQHDRCRG